MRFRDEQGILYAVEIDKTQDMRKNEEKLKRYAEFSQLYNQKYGKVPIVHFFTVSAHRQGRVDPILKRAENALREYYAALTDFFTLEEEYRRFLECLRESEHDKQKSAGEAYLAVTPLVNQKGLAVPSDADLQYIEKSRTMPDKYKEGNE